MCLHTFTGQSCLTCFISFSFRRRINDKETIVFTYRHITKLIGSIRKQTKEYTRILSHIIVVSA